MSVFNICRAMIASRVAALGITHGSPGVDVPVEERKLPARDESFDALPLIVVCLAPTQGPARPLESAGPAGATDRQDVAVQVVMVSAGNRDAEENIDDHPAWLAKVASGCQGRHLGPMIPGLIGCAVSTDLVIDRQLHSENYDYSGLTVRLAVAVPATTA